MGVGGDGGSGNLDEIGGGLVADANEDRSPTRKIMLDIGSSEKINQSLVETTKNTRNQLNSYQQIIRLSYGIFNLFP